MADLATPIDSAVSRHLHPTALVRVSRHLFVALASLYAAFVLTQVFLAGRGIFVGPAHFRTHGQLAQRVGWLGLVLLVLAFTGRFSRPLKWRAFAVVFLLAAQFLTIHLPVAAGHPELRAIHPVTGFLLFVAVLGVLRHGWATVRASR